MGETTQMLMRGDRGSGKQRLTGQACVTPDAYQTCIRESGHLRKYTEYIYRKLDSVSLLEPVTFVIRITHQSQRIRGLVNSKSSQNVCQESVLTCYTIVELLYRVNCMRRTCCIEKHNANGLSRFGLNGGQSK